MKEEMLKFSICLFQYMHGLLMITTNMYSFTFYIWTLQHHHYFCYPVTPTKCEDDSWLTANSLSSKQKGWNYWSALMDWTDLPYWTDCTITQILSLTIEKKNKTNCFGPSSSSLFPVVWSCCSCEWELKRCKTPFPVVGLKFKWQEFLQMNTWIIYMLYKTIAFQRNK